MIHNLTFVRGGYHDYATSSPPNYKVYSSCLLFRFHVWNKSVVQLPLFLGIHTSSFPHNLFCRPTPLLSFCHQDSRMAETTNRTSNSISSKVIPDSVMEAVNRTSNNIDQLSANFDDVLSLCDADVLSSMPPLQRAQALLLLTKATTTLFALRLRCKGVNPDDHPVRLELERVNLYQEKLQRCLDLSKAPLRPTATVNTQAAARFIGHSLPDLTQEQKRSMREIIEGNKIKYLEEVVLKKRKYQSPEKRNVQTTAQEFLKKAARELLGDNTKAFKGPLRLPDDSDEEDLLMG